ncbi:ABC transporter permease [Pseudobacteriovorax antillogorgiicola]|nr:ABC transporter permease [Pseudobacteriovorax antillogorgiicola]
MPFLAITKKEFLDFGRSPLVMVILVSFLLMINSATFFLGRILDRNQADLASFFQFMPWVLSFFTSAIGIKFWAEERQRGTIQLLLTWPVTLMELVIGKFLASWFLLLIGLGFTWPLIASIAYLGQPDYGTIFSGYLAAWLLAGTFLSLAQLASTFSGSQVLSFILSLCFQLALLLPSWTGFLAWLGDFLPASLIVWLREFGILHRFQNLTQGVLYGRDIGFFLSITLLGLSATIISLRRNRDRL